MGPRYRCLVLDHDDTAVDGTAAVHYPAHLRAMELLRPDLAPVDLEGWFRKNFEPGIMRFLTEELGLTPEELLVEHRVWREHATSREPSFYPGFLDVLADHRAAGGLLAVVSHSETDVIERHYRLAGREPPLLPDLVLGWDDDETRRKPSPWPLQEIMRRFGVAPDEVLVVDDLRPGVVMARAAGVAVAAAGWAHRIPEIEASMRRECVAYLEDVAALRAFVLG